MSSSPSSRSSDSFIVASTDALESKEQRLLNYYQTFMLGLSIFSNFAYFIFEIVGIEVLDNTLSDCSVGDSLGFSAGECTDSEASQQDRDLLLKNFIRIQIILWPLAVLLPTGLRRLKRWAVEYVESEEDRNRRMAIRKALGLRKAKRYRRPVLTALNIGFGICYAGFWSFYVFWSVYGLRLVLWVQDCSTWTCISVLCFICCHFVTQAGIFVVPFVLFYVLLWKKMAAKDIKLKGAKEKRKEERVASPATDMGDPIDRSRTPERDSSGFAGPVKKEHTPLPRRSMSATPLVGALGSRPGTVAILSTRSQEERSEGENRGDENHHNHVDSPELCKCPQAEGLSGDVFSERADIFDSSTLFDALRTISNPVFLRDMKKAGRAGPEPSPLPGSSLDFGRGGGVREFKDFEANEYAKEAWSRSALLRRRKKVMA